MKEKQFSILIVGGGIAGSAAALCMQKQGFETTVVEQDPGLRPGGQAIDVRGVALQVVERIGLLPQVTYRHAS